MLDVDDELDVWRTKVSDYVLVCAEVPGSVLFCWRLRTLKNQTKCCRNSVTLGSLMPLKILEPTSCPVNEQLCCCAAAFSAVTAECLLGDSHVFLCSKHFCLGTCYQILNCFYSLCQLFIVYIVFKMTYFISNCF